MNAWRATLAALHFLAFACLLLQRFTVLPLSAERPSVGREKRYADGYRAPPSGGGAGSSAPCSVGVRQRFVRHDVLSSEADTDGVVKCSDDENILRAHRRR